VREVHVSPDGVDGETERPMVPVSPFSAVSVIVEVPEMPGAPWDGLTEPAVIEKSVILKKTMAVCGPKVPPAPVTVTV
jgi:hypothetical protein